MISCCALPLSPVGYELIKWNLSFYNVSTLLSDYRQQQTSTETTLPRRRAERLVIPVVACSTWETDLLYMEGHLQASLFKCVWDRGRLPPLSFYSVYFAANQRGYPVGVCCLSSVSVIPANQHQRGCQQEKPMLDNAFKSLFVCPRSPEESLMGWSVPFCHTPPGFPLSLPPPTPHTHTIQTPTPSTNSLCDVRESATWGWSV